MKSVGSRLAGREGRTIAAALFSVLLASCTSAGDPTMSVGMPGYNATASDIAAASGTSPAAPGDSTTQVTSTAQVTSTGPQMMMTAAGDATLPEPVSYTHLTLPTILRV